MKKINYDKLRDEILEYQKKKNELVRTYSGIDLIHRDAMLNESFLSEEIIEKIAYKFENYHGLGSCNCLHCNISPSDCSGCKVFEVDGKRCHEDSSRFKRVSAILSSSNKIEDLNKKLLVLSTELDKILNLEVYGISNLEEKVFSVWVDGVEVNDYLLTIREAKDLTEEYLEKDYKDVEIMNMSLSNKENKGVHNER